MPVPDSYTRKYGGRDESSFSTFSSTRSATRPGFISSSYTSKLSAATLPPRPSYERKLSTESSVTNRYLSGSRTIPTYGTSSLRGSSSPVRASTTTAFRRDGPSVSDRIKSYDLSSGEKEFTSRFLKPREASVSLSTTSKLNGYLPRDRSESRDLGFGSRERSRDVRGNIITRAASIGPSAISRAARNGHSTISQSSEVTPTSKSNASSEASSANVSRGVSPPNSNNIAPTIPNHADIVAVNAKCSRVESNRNNDESPLSISKTVTTKVSPPISEVASSVGSSAQLVLSNGHSVEPLSQGVNGNERENKGQSVKMITETKDSNGNDMMASETTLDSCGDGSKSVTPSDEIPSHRTSSSNGDFSFKKLDSTPVVSRPKVIFHKISTGNDEACVRNKKINLEDDHCDNKAEIDSIPKSTNKIPESKIESTKSKSIMSNYSRRKSGSPISSGSGVLNSKLSANDVKYPVLKEDRPVGNGLYDRARSLTRQQSPSPVRQVGVKLKRSPSPAQLSNTPSSTSTSSVPPNFINYRKHNNSPGFPHKESEELLRASPASISIRPPPAASRESSLSRSPSPSTSIPNPPPLPSLHVNGNLDSDGEMAGPYSSRYGDKMGPGASNNRAQQSDSSDNDTDNYTSPTLGGRFRSSGERNSDSDKDAGLTGLRNIGNTCFMNSVLQCLSNTKPLLEYMLRKGYTSDINTTTSGMKGALIKAYAEICHELWRDSKTIVDTTAFKNEIQRFASRFTGYSQQDAQEFLRYLLEGLHEDINRVTVKPKPILTEIDDSWNDTQKATESWKRYLRSDDSKIVDLFVGQLKSTLKCTTCGHCSVTFDPFWDLSLPIPSKTGQVRLSQCLELFTKEEVLDGDEKPTCAKCQTRRKCTKSFSIQKFPKVLVIHLKRFSPTERYRGKLSTAVDFPLHGLDMTPYAANRSQGCVYNLYGVANHSGSTYSGHYVAYCKHPYNQEWYIYNDSRVSPISSQSVVSSDGYLLFYELSNTSHE